MLLREYFESCAFVIPLRMGEHQFKKNRPQNTHQGLKRIIALSLGITSVYLLSFTTVSTCGVFGNISTQSIFSTLYPASFKIGKSLAKEVGLHEI